MAVETHVKQTNIPEVMYSISLDSIDKSDLKVWGLVAARLDLLDLEAVSPPWCVPILRSYY